MRTREVYVAGRLHQGAEASVAPEGRPELVCCAFREMDNMHSGSPWWLGLVCLLFLFGINAALRQFEVVLGGELLIRIHRDAAPLPF